MISLSFGAIRVYVHLNVSSTISRYLNGVILYSNPQADHKLSDTLISQSLQKTIPLKKTFP